ncbi:acyl-CoA dehydrogenase [Rathayibacter rathayi]|uniref:Acyl-CoA dehydrogenase n=1 Tax=Rathayibacter rathayi TaxID=33887 RepID=A0ABD6WCH7_RATRA|nr:acyl-CoA dehydrogenase family protein [Rathayibacter rathayi]AZZ49264.1 acyl-CoA dehydrogenase [Rathayibacter rathayi]MWV73338.1 acyl-CoA dehydrogenase [Rathayibacter rathayi NCPPB 2980 = VKM Ac-1601]PPF16411.1 acyl-CoA dehydrogenase [Rathayibacter rathayi]PPF52002.1 acyl-CoA dehydrogenase [Rathayibacter rathayi]PPF83609.1 acyl-CoA dehydrogenase [Rathayibacter rathayi]
MGRVSILDDALLERFRGRAADYDERNAFCYEDLEELRAIGYLALLVPEDLGGVGVGLEQAAAEQTRLATAAPATALAVNMHLVWTGIARLLLDRGDDSLRSVLVEAAAGHVFAFGNSEAGNDLVLSDSLTRAEPVGDGGYRFTGTKVFTSLAPVWTRLGVFGRDDSGPQPCLVHGFVDRETPETPVAGLEVHDDWDTLGMRATQSRTTVLDGVVVPAERMIRSLPVGPSADPFVFAVFAAFELLISSVYLGVAQRALDVAVVSVQRRTSLRSGGRPLAEDPDVRHRVAAVGMLLDGLQAPLRSAAADVDALVDRGARWFPSLVGVKIRTTEGALRVVESAVRIAGGSAYARRSELGRLSRDVLAGQFHPSDDSSAHGAWASLLLGPLPPTS